MRVINTPFICRTANETYFCPMYNSFSKEKTIHFIRFNGNILHLIIFPECACPIVLNPARLASSLLSPFLFLSPLSPSPRAPVRSRRRAEHMF